MPKVKNYIEANGKILILLVLSLICVLLINYRYQLDTFNIFEVSFATGFFHQVSIYIASYYLLKYTDKKRWHTYFRPDKRYSAGTLFFNLGQFLLLIFIIPYNAWNVASTTLLLVAFIAGMCTGQLAIKLIIKDKVSAKKLIRNVSQLDGERYEAFIATLIATVVLGSSFLQIDGINIGNQLNGLILLPIMYSLLNAVITYFFLCALQNYPKITEKFFLLISLLSVVVHFYIIKLLPKYLLPNSFLLRGNEYSTEQLQAVMVYGLYSGFIAGVVVWGYHSLSQIHINQLLKSNKPKIKYILYRFLLNVIIYLIPVGCVLFTFMFSLNILGLYGLTISFLCMLSNIGLKLFIQNDRLDFYNKIDNFTIDQVEHLKATSPNFKSLILGSKENKP